jgi:hypothetical protein
MGLYMISESQDTETHPLFLSLRDIASWTPGACEEVQTSIRASIPALQRGLVWSPQQNELLWDSILRGFPIGAVVVTKHSKKLAKSNEREDLSITHHLLDGQQRCNAIAMGFLDPFALHTPAAGKKSESLLWLDLRPKFEPNSTRGFLVRATTTAHPWGYRKDDAASPLSIGDVRQALARVGLKANDPKYQRPLPTDLSPYAADAPVPLSWLLKLPIQDENLFWTELGSRAAEAGHLKWAARVLEFCQDPAATESKSRVFRGIKKAHATIVIALEAPAELLEVSEQEKQSGNDKEDVSNIEQLFQRLNQQGTKLDGEELAYSMIKAYWPDLEAEINEVSKPRMPQARMVSLGVRAALAKDAKDNLPGPPTVSALRAIARSEKPAEIERKESIESFINRELRSTCERVDRWLKYDPVHNPSGLLPVHVTSIALNSREVYLLLLHFARGMAASEEPVGWNKTMQALCTAIHWFAPEKAKVANRVFAQCRERSLMRHENIRTALLESMNEGEMHQIHRPEAVERLLDLPDANFKDWNWWAPIQGDGKPEGILQRRRDWEGFLNFRKEKELLLYAQRGFLASRFPHYEPARKDLWEAHNRPWDYDHLLAWKFFYNRKDGSLFRSVCGEWGNTIGNFRAWPFEDNRSDQAQKAREKLSMDGKLDANLLEQSFIEPEQVDGFSGGDSTRGDEATARLFAETCRSRLLKIYRAWYESADVAALVTPGKGPADTMLPNEFPKAQDESLILR